MLITLYRVVVILALLPVALVVAAQLAGLLLPVIGCGLVAVMIGAWFGPTAGGLAALLMFGGFMVWRAEQKWRAEEAWRERIQAALPTPRPRRTVPTAPP